MSPAGATDFGRGVATVATPTRTVRIGVEVATTRAQIARGLMYRRRIAANRGMIFLFQPDVREWFWMKNTLIPLSIAFFDDRGRIVKLFDMTPCRREPCAHYDPGRRIRGALEVRRGLYRRIGVRIGDRIGFRRASG